MDDDSKTCPRCAETVKRKAVACRFCGYEFDLSSPEQQIAENDFAQVNSTKDVRKFWLAVGGFALLMVILGLFSSKPVIEEDTASALANKLAKAKLDEELRAQRIHYGEICKSFWDGSISSVVSGVKSQLRDPNSFEHDQTLIFPVGSDGKKDGLHPVKMSFRSRNGFGGMTRAFAEARVRPGSCSASGVRVIEE